MPYAALADKKVASIGAWVALVEEMRKCCSGGMGDSIFREVEVSEREGVGALQEREEVREARVAHVVARKVELHQCAALRKRGCQMGDAIAAEGVVGGCKGSQGGGSSSEERRQPSHPSGPHRIVRY